MTDTIDETTTDASGNEPTVRIDPETGNKIITVERNGETFDFVIGSSPEGTNIWQRGALRRRRLRRRSRTSPPTSTTPTPPTTRRRRRSGRSSARSGCPVAHSDRYGGMWVPITHDTVHEVAYDTENFTSRNVVVSVGRPGDLALPAPIGVAPPITSDPPFHTMARALLLPPFAPRRSSSGSPRSAPCAASCSTTWASIAPGETVIDAAVQYAQHIPVNVIRRMLGFPEKDEELFRKFVHDALERITEEPGTRIGGGRPRQRTSPTRSRTTERTRATT